MTASSFCELIFCGSLHYHHFSSCNIYSNSYSLIALAWILTNELQKGAYVDRCERDDVVAYCKEYLKKLDELREAHLLPPLCSDEGAATLPEDGETKKESRSYLS